MTRVYVDAPVHQFGRMVMCHMFSPDLGALHDMADRIRVQRRWFQDPRSMSKVSWPHYDICKSKRGLALTAGAVEVDKYQMVAMAAVVRNIYFGDNADPMRFMPEREAPRIADWLIAEGCFPL